MSNFSYVAVDTDGKEQRGMLEVDDQAEALRQIREMGLFPMKLIASSKQKQSSLRFVRKALEARAGKNKSASRVRVKTNLLAVFTRQTATLIEAGMPLLRSLQLLKQQMAHAGLKRVIGGLELDIENGASFAESLKGYPKIFDRLYVSMVKAGEISGALELSLRRLAEFMEKAQKIKGKVKAALFYPSAVLLVAFGIMTLLMVYVLPKFKLVFDGLMNGAQMPAFTVFVFNVSEFIKSHLLSTALLIGVLLITCMAAGRTRRGAYLFDWLKLKLPALGPVFRKAAIGRFARTMATLSSSGVPILQALTIVKETAGNVLIANVISRVHENVKQGEPIAPALRDSTVFPLIVSGMVDVGEQTGALPDMLKKIADNCDEEVENAANAMTSLLEPILLVFLAVIVGSIVIAMFLPLLRIMDLGFDTGADIRRQD
jgi:type IV pilus assembly protein PilC